MVKLFEMGLIEEEPVIPEPAQPTAVSEFGVSIYAYDILLQVS